MQIVKNTTILFDPLSLHTLFINKFTSQRSGILAFIGFLAPLKTFFDKKFTNVLSNRLKCITKYVYYGNITYIL